MTDITSQFLFWYKPLFAVQLLFAEVLFSLGLERRRFFALRAVAGVCATVGAAFALPVMYNAAYCSAMFLIIFAVSVAAFKFAFREPFKNIIFCAIAGYTVQHTAQELFELFNVAVNLNGSLSSDFYGSGSVTFGDNWFVVTLYVWLYGMTYWGAYMLFCSGERRRRAFGLTRISVLVLVVVIVLIDVIFSSIVTYAVPAGSDRLAVGMLHVYNICCCVLALVLLFELPRRKRLERELNAVRQINLRRREQYEVSKETISRINIKYHDIKHQIRSLAGAPSVSADAVREIESMIGDYDAEYRTGSDALDVILTEKSMLCRKLSVTFKCMADGSSLGFMNESDIYSLFGNILDNAIEAVSKPDSRSRVISLTVRAVGGLVIIGEHNKYTGELRFDGGLPLSTKQSEDHGFGMKSIRYTVTSYGGEMNVSASEGVFSLGIAIPVPGK